MVISPFVQAWILSMQIKASIMQSTFALVAKLSRVFASLENARCKTKAATLKSMFNAANASTMYAFAYLSPPTQRVGTPIGTVESQIQYSWNETQWQVIPQVVEHSEISLVKLLLTISIIYNSLKSIYCCHMHWERASWASSKFNSSAHEWITAGRQTLLFILVIQSVVMILSRCKSVQPHWKKLFCLLFTQTLVSGTSKRVVTLISIGDHLTDVFQVMMPRPFPIAGY